MTVTRRLVAIFYADVAGYSRLTGADEEGTHRRVMALLDEVTEKIKTSGGEVLRYAGDAILAVFPSVVLAVDTSASIQTDIAERNAGLPEDERVQIRIGINVGDVIEDRGEVYGEGVNLAARLEAAAEPGGLCISDDAYKQCRKRSVLTFRDGGELEFKNIEGTVHVYHWAPGAVSEVLPPKDEPLPLPDKPSIAVLPFNNMSGDPEQEYFSDGITEDIITELSRFRELLVIARNSSFTFKGSAVDIKEVGRKLGVAYVVEGSVRRAGKRVRVTAQVIEVESSSHIWAERYDRDLEDIFDVQDEITRNIVAAVGPEIVAALGARALRKPPESLTAWERVIRGNQHMFRTTREDMATAARLFDEAIAIDPNYAAAHSAKAYLTIWMGFQGWGGPMPDVLSRAMDSAGTALALDSTDTAALYAAGFVHSLARHPDLAIQHNRAAIKLNPNFPDAYFGLGVSLIYAGQIDEGLEAFDMTLRLSPRGIFTPFVRTFHGLAALLLGSETEALNHVSRSLEERRDFSLSYLVMASTAGHLGDRDKARSAAQKVLEFFPNFTLSRHEAKIPIAPDGHRQRYIEGLRRAGLPE